MADYRVIPRIQQHGCLRRPQLRERGSHRQHRRETPRATRPSRSGGASRPRPIPTARSCDTCTNDPLRPRDLCHPPIPRPRQLDQPTTNPRGHSDFAATHPSAPKTRQTCRRHPPLPRKARLITPHTTKSLQPAPITPLQSQSLNNNRTLTPRHPPTPPSHPQKPPRAQAVRRPKNTPAASTDTTTIPTLHATAVTAAAPGACPASSARSESITAVTGWWRANP